MNNKHLGLKTAKDLERELEESNSGIMDASLEDEYLDFYKKAE